MILLWNRGGVVGGIEAVAELRNYTVTSRIWITCLVAAMKERDMKDALATLWSKFKFVMTGPLFYKMLSTFYFLTIDSTE